MGSRERCMHANRSTMSSKIEQHALAIGIPGCFIDSSRILLYQSVTAILDLGSFSYVEWMREPQTGDWVSNPGGKLKASFVWGWIGSPIA